jgi:hypothetical protein
MLESGKDFGIQVLWVVFEFRQRGINPGKHTRSGPIVLGPFSHGAFVWAVTMNQYLFGGPTVLLRLSGIPKAWLRCGSSKTPQRRDMTCRLVFD